MSESKPARKSILDDVPVVNSAFKSFPDYTAQPCYAGPQGIELPQALEVVSTCPKCGAPIYGPRSVRQGEAAQVQKTCLCVVDDLDRERRRRDVRDSMHTK